MYQSSSANKPHKTCSGSHNTRVVYRSSDLDYHDNNMVVVLVEDMEYSYVLLYILPKI